ncbi:DEAD/DEAH box helicase [Stenoxybacter acetivorans]|uniref:DEAD/DEAH box helicase n=1 Tax=Stenoxybacter acetivorans TaxID=422441 RepID=UPI0005614C55|nr:DEAD/DEAH box helicase [Stenoxybacter acetivorans]
MSLSFTDLHLDQPLTDALLSAGYDSPTPVQLEAIPAALSGQDLMVSAQTGSGKTAAFLLPALQKMLQRSEKPGKGPRLLVLTPTRELAQQVEKQAQVYGKNMPWLRTVTLVGGTSFGQQIRALSRPIDVIVATPGRLMDHMRQDRIDFSRLDVLVLDEADRMLDMGFIEDIETIVAAIPESRQTLLFSATWDGIVGKLAKRLTRQAQQIDIARVAEQGKIDEQLLYCDDMRHKNRLLDHILRDANIDQCVIFTSTKVMSEQLADELYEKGFSANCLHGDMPQGWRNRTLMDLRKGRIKILVATDVAARGIDVPTITHVINYDLPKQAEDYVHRIGRTGRAGRHGLALTFAEVNEYVKIHKIERYLNRKLPEMAIEGMEPTRKRSSAKPAPKGRRGGNFSGQGKSGNWSSDRPRRHGNENGGQAKRSGGHHQGQRKPAHASR